MNLTEIFARIGDPSPVFEGNGWAAICPAHSDHSPSLRVAIAEGGRLVIKCRVGCEWNAVLAAMGVSAFHELEPVVDDMDRSARPVNDTGALVPVADQAAMAAYLDEASQEIPEAAAQYMARRFGIDPYQAEILGLGFDGGSIHFDLIGHSYHAVPRLVVPFRDFQGVPRGFQSRALVPHKVRWMGPSNPETGVWAPFAFFKADSGLDYCLVTEGPGDGLASFSAGFDSVAIRGAAMAPKVAPYIVEHLRDRPIVLAGDNDDAGRMFNASLASLLLAEGMTVHELILPDGVKDIGEWFERGPESFLEGFQSAVARAPRVMPGAAERASHEEVSEDLGALATDQGLAVFLRDHFDGDLLHSPGLGFFLFEGGHWARDDLNRVRVWCHEAADELDLDAERIYQDTIRALNRTTDADTTPGPYEAAEAAKGLRRGAVRRLRTTYTLSNVLIELAAMSNVAATDFDQHRNLLSVKNGTIDLATGELGPHDRAHLITNQLKMSYVPDAKAPRWEMFLREIMPRSTNEMVDYLQRLVGYGITGFTSEQCFSVLHGRGANGKSVFTDTLSQVFEELTVTTPFSTFEKKMSGGIPNDLAALRGSRLVMASEGGAGNQMAEDVIKRVTGSDLISARFMRAEFFSFRPTFLIMLATNHKPAFRGQDEGLWRRVKLIPFTRFFSPGERDPKLTENLVAEAEGILAWAVRGAASWFEGGMREPGMVTKAVDDYRGVMDALAGFFPGVLDPADEEESIKGSVAYGLYSDWAFEEGVPSSKTWSQAAFYAAMEERGVFRKKRKDGIHLFGVSFPKETPLSHNYSETTSTPSTSIFDRTSQ